MVGIDIEMPKNCDCCPCRQMNLARCQIRGKSTSHHPTGKPMNQTIRLEWCPLIDLDDDGK